MFIICNFDYLERIKTLLLDGLSLKNDVRHGYGLAFKTFNILDNKIDFLSLTGYLNK